MKITNKAGFYLLIFLVTLGIAQILYYYPQLPDKLAIHFNLKGEADNWSHKIFLSIMYLIVLFIIAGGYWFKARAADWPWGKGTDHDYWFSLERKDRTLARIRNCHLKTGNAFLLMLIVVNQYLIHVNLKGEIMMSGHLILYILAAFLVYAMYQYLSTYLYFKKSRKNSR